MTKSAFISDDLDISERLDHADRVLELIGKLILIESPNTLCNLIRNNIHKIFNFANLDIKLYRLNQ